MTQRNYSVITGTGAYIPSRVIKNQAFTTKEFYNSQGERILKPGEEIVEKFYQITEIEERRYVDDEYVTSDIAFFAAEEALKSSNTDRETLDYIIVAHNFGDVKKNNLRSDMVPTLASRIKAKLGIKNPFTVAYDLPFGCPGWLQAMIHADYFIRSGDAKKIMVIGSEILSRVSDPHDIDSMLYSDGAGATILECAESDEPKGIITHSTRSDSFAFSQLLRMDKSYNPDFNGSELFLKMNGRKLYEYALNTVPQLVKDCIAKAGIFIQDVKKILIHQANAKMNEAILTRIFKLFNIQEIPSDIMPMTISKFGNNSVATIPILLDMLLKNKMSGHNLYPGDYFVFASVGAGMNVNVVIYKMT